MNLPENMALAESPGWRSGR